MGSYAYITIADYPIDSTKNFFTEWYFRRSERRIFRCKRSECKPLIWGLPEDVGANPDEIEENYVYETSAATLKRRLELAGHTRKALEQEFAEAIAQRVRYAEEYDSGQGSIATT